MVNLTSFGKNVFFKRSGYWRVSGKPNTTTILIITIEMNENLPQNQHANNGLNHLNEFESGLKQVLNLHNLPTMGVFVDIPERVNVFKKSI